MDLTLQSTMRDLIIIDYEDLVEFYMGFIGILLGFIGI